MLPVTFEAGSWGQLALPLLPGHGWPWAGQRVGKLGTPVWSHLHLQLHLGEVGKKTLPRRAAPLAASPPRPSAVSVQSQPAGKGASR